MGVKCEQLARRVGLASVVGLGIFWDSQPVVAQPIPQPPIPQPPIPQPPIPQPPVPQQTVPQLSVPLPLIPQPPTPRLSVSRQTVPQQTVPQQTGFQPPVPQQAVPQQTGSQPPVPQQAVPQQTGSQPPVPQQTAPLPLIPQQTVPQQTVPQQTVPQLSVPFPLIPQPPAPRLSVSQQTVPQQTVPQQTVSRRPTVAALSDVSPDDWAFQALQQLVEEYGCIQRDLNQAYRGKDTLSRFEYAATLDACLTYLIDRGELNNISPDNLAILQRLQTEFGDELRRHHNSLEALDDRVVQIESESFSIKTQLRGEVVFALAEAFGDQQVGDPDTPVDQRLVSGYRARLNFDTSFSGEDRLRIRLQGRDIPELEESTGTPMANLGFDGADEDNVEITDIAYRVPIGEQLTASINPVGAGIGDYVPTINPLFSSSGSGSISNMGRENPITRQGNGTGFGLSYDVTDTLNVAVGHVARRASNPSVGLFGDRYSAIAQITYAPVEAVSLGATYVNSMNNVNTGTGSDLANDPFQGLSDQVRANAWGVETSIQVSPQVTLGGRAGLINATASDLAGSPSATVWTWSALLGISDVGSEDSLLGIVLGQPPKLTQNSLGSQFVDPATSLHLETFYRWQVNDALSVTPGVMYITNPDHDESNSDLAVVTLRTTLKF